MMPRIEAGEMLNMSTAMALGSGALKKGDAQRLRSILERRTGEGAPRAAKVSLAVLEMIGIGVEVQSG